MKIPRGKRGWSDVRGSRRTRRREISRRVKKKKNRERKCFHGCSTEHSRGLRKKGVLSKKREGTRRIRAKELVWGGRSRRTQEGKLERRQLLGGASRG